MEKIASEPRSMIFSIRLYRALLAVYPSEFRRDYGDLMLQVFRDSSRRALREGGSAALFSLWGRTMLDTVQTAIEEHSYQGVEMSRDKFTKLSGWALMLGGLALLLGWLAGTRPEYNPYNARSLAIDQYANAVDGPLSVMAMFLLSVGFIGLYLRYRQGTSNFGWYSLGLGALSSVISTIGASGLAIDDSGLWWNIFFFGLIFQFLGLALFGIANLKQQSLPRWNGLPLLAGVWVPLYVLVGLLIEQGSGSWVEWPLVVDVTMWFLVTAGLVSLGFLLQSDSGPAAPAAVAV